MKVNSKKYFVNKLIVTIFAFIILALFIFPIYWLITMSLKTNVDIFNFPPNLIFTPILDAYHSVFGRADFVGAFFSSIIVSFATTAICLIVGLMAAYSVVTFNFRGKRFLQIMIMLLRIAPSISMLIPLFMIFSTMGLVNTHFSVIMCLVAFLLSFTVWLLLGYLREVPKDLIYSALIDGSGYTSILIRIVIPLSAPGIAAVGILVFAAAWNEFIISSVMVNTASRTLPVLIRGFLGEQTIVWNELAAVGVIISIPALIVTVIAQKYIVGGLTLGAVKG